MTILTDHDFTWATARSWLTGLPEGAGSTSPTRRWTATSPPGGATGSRCASCPARWPHRTDVRGAGDRTNRFANVLDGARRAAAASGSSCSPGGSPSCTSPSSAALEAPRAWSARCSRPSAPSRSASDSQLGEASVLVTTPALYERKVAGLRDRAARACATCSSPATSRPEGTLALGPLLARRAPPSPRSSRPTPDDLALLHFTSGTTGRRRARCTSTRRWSPTTPPAAGARSARRTTCSGARPTRAG